MRRSRGEIQRVAERAFRVGWVRDTHRALLERMRAEDGKGQKHRVVPLPARLEDRLREQLREVRASRVQDLAQGSGEVFRHCILGTTFTWTGIAGRID